MNPPMRRLFAAALLIMLAMLPPARAAEVEAFNAAVAEAAQGYRAGLFYLRTGNAGLAAIELGAAASAWEGVESTFTADPPAAFAGDGQFAATLQAIGDALDDGLAKANAGDAEAAQKTVSRVRDMLFELRRRNSVDVYADCVTELNRQMDVLYVYRRTPPDLADAAQVAALKSDGEKYAATLARCREMAPAPYKAEDEFQRLYDGTAHSVSTLAPAAETGDARTVINVLRELHSFDRMIFLRWG